jgi:filamentous hemagglutinin family protein
MNRLALKQLLAAGFIVAGIGPTFGNPTGGQVASGSAAISTVPGTVTINQASNIAIINWQTFSIGAGELTQFVQPGASSAALNRVLGGGISSINGTLSANGQVMLINGNGIVVGPGGAVNAYGFVASTRDITDSDFLSGTFHFTGNSNAGVQNFGKINALGGDVYLIGKTVDNQGTINAASGTAGLASGDDVVLNFSGQEHVFVNPSPTAVPATTQTAVHNSGTISAASAELKAANGNMFALAINNEGTIRATSVAQKGGHIFLTTDGGLVQNTGVIAAKSGSNGGTVKITGGSLWNRKTITASGSNGGNVTINSANVQNDGSIDVSGTQGAGGTVDVTYSGNVLASVAGSVNASGKAAGGTIDFLGTGSTSEAYLSLALNVNSASGVGGNIDLATSTFYLTGAKLTANGATGGGRIFVGEGDPASSPTLSLAKIAFVSVGTSLEANATASGNGGQIGVNSTGATDALGVLSAKSAHGSNGSVNVAGPAISTPSTPATGLEFVDPDPRAGNEFGRPSSGLFNLASNTTLITSPGDSFGGTGAGAAYIFSDTTGALLSTIRGSHAHDGVGTTVQLLGGTNFVIKTPDWDGNIGALSFGSGLGFTAGGGAVSAANSLIGAASGDEVGSGGLVELFDGNFLVLSPNFNGGAGAVTWTAPTGAVGVVSSGNSLVGAVAGDNIGSGGIERLSNGANYLVLSPNFNGGAGAITNGSNGSAISGVVSATTSLVGASSTDAVGTPGSIEDSGLGYYLVTTANFNGGAGAVTWNSSTLGTKGVISAANSLVGSASSDAVGSGGITILFSNDNYVVDSPDWDGGKGAVTLGIGSSGVSGAITSSNSLIGATSGDHVGSGGIQALFDSQNFLIFSPTFGNSRSAVTVASDVTGVTGVLSTSNSLVGANSGDDLGSGGITQLESGNILILSPTYQTSRGAVTFVNPDNGISGTIGSGNSLVGAATGDHVGSGGIVQLSNGSNYLVLSPSWGGGKGAITNGDAFNGISGAVGSGNSFVGTSNGDGVGASGSVIDSFDNYYLVLTPHFNGGAGAVTWNNDVGGTIASIASTNSLIGSITTDHLGSGGVTILSDGNYVVDSPQWTGAKGAVTWGSATGGVHGAVSINNSLVGSTAGDAVGGGGILQLNSGGNYLVLSPTWSGSKGAITDIASSTGLSGAVSSTNSLVGATTGDGVGAADSIIQSFNGYFLALTPNFDGGAGAVTYSNETVGAIGVVGSSNSLVGSAAGDHVGSGGVILLDNGNYLVLSPSWNNLAGAVTLADGSVGLSGFVSSTNSLVGAAGDHVGSGSIVELDNGDFLVLSPDFNGNVGAVTWFDPSATTTFHGTVGSGNSLVGATGGDMIGSGGIEQLNDGTDYLVLSPSWSGGKGAVTQASNSAAITGTVGAGNSLVGASTGDAVGSEGSIIDADGYYLVQTANFDGGAGAVTWNSESAGVHGAISSANSLVGTASSDAVGDGGVTLLSNGNYVVNSPDWNGGKGAVTLGSGTAGVHGAVSGANSLIGATAGDNIGGSGITEFFDGNFLVLSHAFNGNAGAVTFVNGDNGLVGIVSAGNSLVGAAPGDAIGSGGIEFLGDDNYLVLSPQFHGGAGAVTFGSHLTGVTGTVGAATSLVGASSNDHIGSGGIIQLANGNYLVQSPQYLGSTGAVTWGSETSGVNGTVSGQNSITGGAPNAGEEFAGESANGNIFLISFTTDTSRGGDGRVVGGSVNGPTSTGGTTPTTPTTAEATNFFVDPLVIQFEAQNYDYVLAAREFYIADPDAMALPSAKVDSLEGGAVNNGHGHSIASGSSTANASGPKRLVTPGNGIWNIFAGTVHAAPPPAFITQQLQLNLSPAIFAHLNGILFGKP